ncbi:MAG: hypothetical protein OIF58_11185 [Cohaesibacter sp.]|nr:hypothetical protein [Cohaesibacter sp.]
MLKPKHRPYRSHSLSAGAMRRDIHVEYVPAHGLNAAVVSVAGPFMSKDYRQRPLFLHEAIELRDKLNKALGEG